RCHPAPARRGGRMVRPQPRPSLRAGARRDQGPLTSALPQADPPRVVGNMSSATGLLGDAAVDAAGHTATAPDIRFADLMSGACPPSPRAMWTAVGVVVGGSRQLSKS